MPGDGQGWRRGVKRRRVRTYLAVPWLPERAGGAPGRRVRGRGLDLPPDVGDGVEDVAHGSPAVPTVSIDELLG